MHSSESGTQSTTSAREPSVLLNPSSNSLRTGFGGGMDTIWIWNRSYREGFSLHCTLGTRYSLIWNCDWVSYSRAWTCFQGDNRSREIATFLLCYISTNEPLFMPFVLTLSARIAVTLTPIWASKDGITLKIYLARFTSTKLIVSRGSDREIVEGDKQWSERICLILCHSYAFLWDFDDSAVSRIERLKVYI